MESGAAILIVFLEKKECLMLTCIACIAGWVVVEPEESGKDEERRSFFLRVGSRLRSRSRTSRRRRSAFLMQLLIRSLTYTRIGGEGAEEVERCQPAPKRIVPRSQSTSKMCRKPTVKGTFVAEY